MLRGNESSGPQGSAKVRRTPFRDFVLCTYEISRLLDGSVKPRVSDEFRRGIETVNISDFSDDEASRNSTDTCNRGNYGILSSG